MMMLCQENYGQMASRIDIHISWMNCSMNAGREVSILWLIPASIRPLNVWIGSGTEWIFFYMTLR